MGQPSEWAKVLEVAARCTGQPVDRAGELALIGGVVVLIAILLMLAAALILRTVR